MTDMPGNGWSYRLAEIERRLAHLEHLDPAVVKSQVADTKDDIQQLARELGYIRKILTGFLVSFAIAIAVAAFSLLEAGGAG